MPLLFNDGTPVPEVLLAQTLAELRQRFGAASWETQIVQGVWEQEGAMFKDNLIRFFVDVPDLPEHRAFLKNFKGILKERFRQIDMWITSYPVDII